MININGEDIETMDANEVEENFFAPGDAKVSESSPYPVFVEISPSLFFFVYPSSYLVLH